MTPTPTQATEPLSGPVWPFPPQLLEEIKRLHKENDSDYYRREEERLETEKSIFRFVLKNFGRQKLIEMGRFIDQNDIARKGKDSGYEEHLTDSYGDYKE